MHRTEKRTLTRARLIEAALNVFAFEGYEHATVDDIARAAGLSKGAFYFNFTTKEEILLELLRMWSDERAALLRTAYDAEYELATDSHGRKSYRGRTSTTRTDVAAPGLPFSLSFWSEPGMEQVTLKAASAYEAASRRRIPPPAFGPIPGESRTRSR